MPAIALYIVHAYCMHVLDIRDGRYSQMPIARSSLVSVMSCMGITGIYVKVSWCLEVPLCPFCLGYPPDTKVTKAQKPGIPGHDGRATAERTIIMLINLLSLMVSVLRLRGRMLHAAQLYKQVVTPLKI